MIRWFNLKFKKIFLISIFILAILMIGAVSAGENTTSDELSTHKDNLIQNTNEDSLKDSSWDVNINREKTNTTRYNHVDFYIEVGDDYDTSAINDKSNFSVVLDNITYDEVLFVENKMILIGGPQNLTVGNHTYTAMCLDGSFKTKTFEVTSPITDTSFEKNIVFDNPNDSYKYDIDVTLDSNINQGNISVFIDNKRYVKQEITYTWLFFQINIINVGWGVHDLKILYEGGGEYPTYAIESKINITYKIDMESIQWERYTSGNTLLNVTIPSVLMGNEFITKIDGKVYPHYFNGYNMVIDATRVLNGTHTLVVSYLGDDKFYPASFSQTFSVEKPSVDNNFEKYGIQIIPYKSKDYYFFLNLPIVNAKGKFVVEIWDGANEKLLKNISSALTNGRARIAMPSLNGGDYWYRSYYSGSDIGVDDAQGTFFVRYCITGPGDDESYLYECKIDEDYYVSLKVSNLISGNLTLYVYNAFYDSIEPVKKDLIYNTSVKIVNSEAKIKIPINKLGFYLIESNYTGDSEVENYYQFINVRPSKLIISEEVFIQKPSEFIFTIPGDGNGTIIMHFMDYDVEIFNFTIDVIDGVATYDLSKINVTQYFDYAYLEYKGNYGNVNLTSNWGDTLRVYYVYSLADIIEENGKFRVVLVLPNDEGNITFYLDNNPIARGELINGTLNLTLPDLPYGKHILSAYFDDDPNQDNIFPYDPTRDYNVNVKKTTGVSVKGNGADTKTNLVLTITMDKYTTGKVMLLINGKTYYGNVINGISDINCQKLAEGTYDVKVFYLGDDNFFNESYSTKITVKKAVVTPKIVASNTVMYYASGAKLKIKVYDKYGQPAGKVLVKIKIGKYLFKVYTKNGVAVFKIPNKITPKKYTITIASLGVKVNKKLTVKQILNLKKVNVKKSANNLLLKATLKQAKKPLKAKTITFKFNGKKYKAKTNKKGIAKVVIKKAVLNKLKVGKKIAYAATYLKDTVKRTVKVKP